MSQPEVKFVVAERFVVAESPVWDAARNRLYWCDIIPGVIHALDMESGERSHWTMGEPVGSLGLAQGDRLVVALRQDVVLFDPVSGARETIASVELAKPEMRLNDGKVGPDGAFWAGSMDLSGDRPPAGELYRFGVDGSVRLVAQEIAVSNGLAWNAAGDRLYHSDSRNDICLDVWDFDVATGEATNRRRLREHDEANGRFDGGACDMDGNYWSAAPSASRINRFSPEGVLLDWVDVPLHHPTMPCFGGPDLRTVYVTGRDSGMAGEAHDGIVSFRVDVPGVPVGRFGR